MPSQTYSQTAGAMPLPSSFAWRDWYRRLLAARVAYCDVARTNTYYFAQAGNDTTGAGTLASPWKSIAKAQAVHDASNGNIALLFNRGDEWNETTGLTISKDNVTVAAYGTGAKPYFNAFANKVAASGWTQDGSTDRWTRTTAAVGWVRENSTEARLFSPLRKMASTAEVAATPRSWYWASNTLSVNLGVGVDVNTRTTEWVGDINDHGIEVSGDCVLVENIRFDGWGCVAGQDYQAWGFVFLGTGTNTCLFRGCEAYYNGKHNAGTLTQTSGGICSFVNCSVGYCNNTTAGGIAPFVFFCLAGGNETLADGCVVRFGQLPDGNYDPSAYVGSASYFGHCNQTNATAGLVVLNGCSTTYESGLTLPMFAAPYAYNEPNDLPGTGGDLSTYRWVCAGFTCTGLPSTMRPGYMAFPAKHAYVNCSFDIACGGTINAVLIPIAGAGHVINTIINFSEHVEAGNPGRNVFHNSEAVAGTYLNCHFKFDGTNAAHAWILSQSSSDTGLYFANTIFNNAGTKTFDSYATDTPANAIRIATYNAATNFANALNRITLSASPSLTADPVAAILDLATRGAMGVSVEFDINWRPRGDVYSVGPREPLRCPQHLDDAIRSMITSKPLATEVINALEAGSATLSDRAKRAIRIGVAKRAVSSNLIASIEAGTEPSEMTTQQMGKVFGDRRIAEWLRLILAAA